MTMSKTTTADQERLETAKRRAENCFFRHMETGDTGIVESVFRGRGNNTGTIRCKVHYDSGRVGYEDLGMLDVW